MPLIILLIVLVSPAKAANGLNIIGFGSESVGMGGADVAVAQDAAALNINPAGLTQIDKRRLDATLFGIFALDVGHDDQFGNDVEVPNNPILGSNLGYAHHLDEWPLTIGLGLFLQGGLGYEYRKLNTAFNTRDDLVSLFGSARLTPGVAWQATDKLALGASLLVTYATFEQEVFPNTSFSNAANPNASFFGFKIDRTDTIALGYKLGAQYRINDWITVGATYSNKTDLTFDDANAQFNLRALRLGRVTYHDVTVEGLSQAQEVGLGLALRPHEALLLAFELTWLNWSDAIQQATLRARNPDNRAAPASLELVNNFNWRDQYAVALGVAYDVAPNWRLRAGYNYGRNPAPDRNLSPTFAPLAEHHLTLGAGYAFSPRWRMDAALEYIVHDEVTYTNPDLPFGANAAEKNEVLTPYLTLSRIW